MSFLSFAKRAKGAGQQFAQAVWSDFRDDKLGQYYSSKPIVVQLPVNDICNSRCVMCDIWRKEPGPELAPEQLRQILKDPLFESVKYVGINGGEPTLRPDLSVIGRVLVETLPSLQAFGIITNAIGAHTSLDRSLDLAEVAKEARKGFSVMVSLDGVGADHDRNRGRAGNFESAIKVIDGLRKANVTVSVGCTLTSENCYGADDLLAWCQKTDIQFWEFRLGVDIKRLYNEGFESRHALTGEQRFHLINFFDKLANFPRVDPTHRRFYRSLVGQMAFGRARAAGCDWRSRGVTLDSRGNVSYCSVQSPILGSALMESASAIYKQNLSIRREIIATKCDTCKHDLIGPAPLPIAFHEFNETLVAPLTQRLRRLGERVRKVGSPHRIFAAEIDRPSMWRHVMITGWYGTETAGDKAILAELVHFIRMRSPTCRITITTIDRKISEQTKWEVAGLADASLVELRRASSAKTIETCDAVIFGGGPLEEIGLLQSMLDIFVEANRQRKARIIFGCGVGPLYTERLRGIVGGILRLATAGFVRDEESWDLARELGAPSSISFACDPAIAFLSRWRNGRDRPSTTRSRPMIAGLLRANTSEYLNDLSDEEIGHSNNERARQLATIVGEGAQRVGADILLLPMHTLWVGGDDRIFNREIAEHMLDGRTCEVERRYLTLDQLLDQIASSDVAVAMRYHGHLFSMALGIPFLSIDYTGPKGKVASLVRRLNYTQWSEDWRAINGARASSRLADLFDERQHWAEYLKVATAGMAVDLERVYSEAFPA